jgi:hypothetical protein
VFTTTLNLQIWIIILSIFFPNNSKLAIPKLMSGLGTSAKKCPN